MLDGEIDVPGFTFYRDQKSGREDLSVETTNIGITSEGVYVGLRLVEHKVGIIKGVAQEEFNFLFVSRVYVLFFNNSEIILFR